MAGVSVFLLAQLFHGIYFHSLMSSKKRAFGSLCVRIGLSLIVTSVLLSLESTRDYLYVITGLYAVELVMNLVDCLIAFFLEKEKRLFALLHFFGFLLFFLCDLFVGLSFLNNVQLFRFISWVFYAPSQTLLCSSLLLTLFLQKKSAVGSDA